MAEVMKMPLLSDTMTEGTVAAWHKEVGDKVEIGELLLEIETDKAVMEQDSFFEGYLLYKGVEPGQTVPVDSILAIIGEKGEDYAAALAAAQSKNKVATTEPLTATVEVATPATQEATTDSTENARVKASPLARKMAEEAGLNITHLAGTGENGRIVKRDIEAALETAPAAPQKVVETTTAPTVIVAQPPMESVAVPPPPPTGFGGESYEEVRLSQMRKTIARRLASSKFTAPHFYLSLSINMDQAMETRKRLNEISPVKISFNDLVVKAAAIALRQHPAINASWLGDSIRYNKVYHVGVAVAVGEGLVVPVIQHADMKSLSQIASEVKEKAGKAQERKLTPEEMTGNTFTISNLGMFGIEEFTAIINPPDACIMAVGGIIPTPIVVNGEIKVGNMMKVTLSCDHRVVDGATGAQFLQTFKTILEDPIRMLV